jgi:hypothetical protein
VLGHCARSERTTRRGEQLSVAHRTVRAGKRTSRALLSLEGSS